VIRFLNDAVRGEFHLLPLDRQKEITDSAEHFGKKGMIITVLHVYRVTEKISEIAIRIDPQFNHP